MVASHADTPEHAEQVRGGRRRPTAAAAGFLLAMLLFAACGPGTGRRESDSGAPLADAGAEPQAAAAAGFDTRPHAPSVAGPATPEPAAPRTRQELVGSDGAAPFERFLAGPWYRYPPSSGAAAFEIVHFEPEQRQITFFDGEVQEIYAWNASSLRTTLRIAIRMYNAHVTSVEKTIVAEVVADDELELTVLSSDSDDESEQTGTYRRLGEHERNELIRSTAPQPGMARLNLHGLYRGSDGQTIQFDAPRFTWQQQGRRLSGGFAVYSVGQPVIVFKMVSPAGTTSDIRTYALEFREQRGAERVRRSLTLHPATLEITGLGAIGATALHFEQVELVDAADDEEAEAGSGDATATTIRG